MRFILFICNIFTFDNLAGCYSTMVAIDNIMTSSIDTVQEMFKDDYFNKENKKRINKLPLLTYIDLLVPADKNPYVRNILVDKDYNLFVFLHTSTTFYQTNDVNELIPISFPRVLFSTFFIAVSIYEPKDQQISAFQVMTNFDEINIEYTGARYVSGIKSKIGEYAPKTSYLGAAIFIPKTDIINTFKVNVPHISTLITPLS